MAIRKRRVSPRQKMINLMYVVLMAMLALNISPDILNAFSVVEESLRHTTESRDKENESLYDRFDDALHNSPYKTRPWWDKAQQVRRLSNDLFEEVERLKRNIAVNACGKTALADEDDMANTEASNQVMLSPVNGKAKKLKADIEEYKRAIHELTGNNGSEELLETTVPANKATMGKGWEEYWFENMPAAAAVTLLSKIQNDIRMTEGEALHHLLASVDNGDTKVNSFRAFVIPNAKTIVRGNRLTADIVMAAVDTTQRPLVVVGNRQLGSRNVFETVCNKSGSFSLNGYVEMKDGTGQKRRLPFSQKYSVVEPTATVAADMMNVLYAGYDNPISVSVPGVPLKDVTASTTDGQLTKRGDGKYTVKPLRNSGDVTINANALIDGSNRVMGSFTFHVRRMPNPTPYIAIGNERFKGGAVAKASLLSNDRLRAAIDDGILDVDFKVTGFEMVFFDNMGNAVVAANKGDVMSTRQKELLKSCPRNRRVYISRISVVGKDGINRRLNSSMEIIVR